MQFNERLQELMRKEGLTKYRLARDLGISDAVVGRWANGVAIPRGENLEKLASYFGVSVDYLLGNTNSPEITTLEPEDFLDSITIGNVHLSIKNRNISNDDLMEVMDWLRDQQRRNVH